MHGMCLCTAQHVNTVCMHAFVFVYIEWLADIVCSSTNYIPSSICSALQLTNLVCFNYRDLKVENLLLDANMDLRIIGKYC